MPLFICVVCVLVYYCKCVSLLFCKDVFRWFQIELARDMGYTTARFGHVMFPENVYEPALKCAELLLEGVGKGNFASSFIIIIISIFNIISILMLHE